MEENLIAVFIGNRYTHDEQGHRFWKKYQKKIGDVMVNGQHEFKYSERIITFDYSDTMSCTIDDEVMTGFKVMYGDINYTTELEIVYFTASSAQDTLNWYDKYIASLP